MYGDKYEKEFAHQCDLFEPLIIAYVASLPNKRCYLSDIVRHFFVLDEDANYTYLGEVISCVTLALQSQNIFEWDKDLKLVLRER